MYIYIYIYKYIYNQNNALLLTDAHGLTDHFARAEKLNSRETQSKYFPNVTYLYREMRAVSLIILRVRKRRI